MDIVKLENVTNKHETRTLFLIEYKCGKRIQRHSMFRTEKEIIMLFDFYFETLSKLDLGDRSFMINILKKNKVQFHLFYHHYEMNN